MKDKGQQKKKRERVVLSQGEETVGAISKPEEFFDTAKDIVSNEIKLSDGDLSDSNMIMMGLEEMQRYLVDNNIAVPYGIAVNFNEALDRLDVLLKKSD